MEERDRAGHAPFADVLGEVGERVRHLEKLVEALQSAALATRYTTKNQSANVSASGLRALERAHQAARQLNQKRKGGPAKQQLIDACVDRRTINVLELQSVDVRVTRVWASEAALRELEVLMNATVEVFEHAISSLERGLDQDCTHRELQSRAGRSYAAGTACVRLSDELQRWERVLNSTIDCHRQPLLVKPTLQPMRWRGSLNHRIERMRVNLAEEWQWQELLVAALGSIAKVTTGSGVESKQFGSLRDVRLLHQLLVSLLSRGNALSSFWHAKCVD